MCRRSTFFPFPSGDGCFSLVSTPPPLSLTLSPQSPDSLRLSLTSLHWVSLSLSLSLSPSFLSRFLSRLAPFVSILSFPPSSPSPTPDRPNAPLFPSGTTRQFQSDQDVLHEALIDQTNKPTPGDLRPRRGDQEPTHRPPFLFFHYSPFGHTSNFNPNSTSNIFPRSDFHPPPISTSLRPPLPPLPPPPPPPSTTLRLSSTTTYLPFHRQLPLPSSSSSPSPSR